MSLTFNGTTNIVQGNIGSNVAGTGPAFSAYLNATQIITTNTLTKLTLDAETFDTNSNFTSSRFTPTIAGYYQINGLISGSSTGTITACYSALYKNGAFYKYGNLTIVPSGVGSLACPVSDIVYFNGTTDYAELYGLVIGTATVFFTGGSASSYMSGALVRAA